MTTYPSQQAEDLIASFLPPSCREEVLGDLCESCRSRMEYAMTALSVIPRVIFSQIRRNTNSWVLLLTACALAYSFFAGSSGWSPDLTHPLLRLAIPTVPAVLILLVRNGFAALENRRQRAITLDIVVAMGVAALTQLVLLAAFRSDLMLPRWWPSGGTALAWLFIIVLRAVFPPKAKRPAREAR